MSINVAGRASEGLFGACAAVCGHKSCHFLAVHFLYVVESFPLSLRFDFAAAIEGLLVIRSVKTTRCFRLGFFLIVEFKVEGVVRAVDSEGL